MDKPHPSIWHLHNKLSKHSVTSKQTSSPPPGYHSPLVPPLFSFQRDTHQHPQHFHFTGHPQLSSHSLQPHFLYHMRAPCVPGQEQVCPAGEPRTHCHCHRGTGIRFHRSQTTIQDGPASKAWDSGCHTSCQLHPPLRHHDRQGAVRTLPLVSLCRGPSPTFLPCAPVQARLCRGLLLDSKWVWHCARTVMADAMPLSSLITVPSPLHCRRESAEASWHHHHHLTASSRRRCCSAISTIPPAG